MPVLRSNYGTASLGASVGSSPERAVYGRVLADAEPFFASVLRSILTLHNYSCYLLVVTMLAPSRWQQTEHTQDRMCSPTIECVLYRRVARGQQTEHTQDRMCSLTIECVLLL